MSRPEPVPLLDLRAQYATIRDEIGEAVAGVLESQRFIGGPEVDALEAEVADYVGAPHAVGCGSGSDALLLALMALDIGPGDQVICPSYSFFATASSITRLGAEPVFCDIEPVTYNVDPSAVRKAAAGCKRLRALLPVHLYGQVADLDRLCELGRELGVPVVEDAAQAIGARDVTGALAGSRGHVACYSFFPSKNIGAYGDAGLVTTADAEIAERIRVLRVHGGHTRYHHDVVGLNSRIDALQAAILRVKLRHLEVWHAGRASNARRYDARFEHAGSARSGERRRDGGLPLWTPTPVCEPARHIYNQYVIRVPGELREPLRERLVEREIGCEVYYPLGLHQQVCFAYLGQGAAGALPETEAAANETLALPVYPELPSESLDRVADTVIEFLKGES